MGLASQKNKRQYSKLLRREKRRQHEVNFNNFRHFILGTLPRRRFLAEQNDQDSRAIRGI